MKRQRRVSSRAVATMKPALVDGVLRHRLLTLLSALLVALLLIFAILVSSRHILKQDALNAKEDYRVYSFDVVNEYDHDPLAFTQGLVYADNDTLYESTGMYRSSSVRKVHVQSGKVLQLHRMDNKYFGEGLTLLDHRLFQVAWLITSGFIYDENTLSRLGSFRHPMKDGWGLSTDGKVIYGSDGTSTVYVMQPSSFKGLQCLNIFMARVKV
ncbi:hypothetical protein L7F22_002420 [Adiantum nelumboides]|nr:hypothetical protein [Adiantum nelumboides]